MKNFGFSTFPIMIDSETGFFDMKTIVAMPSVFSPVRDWDGHVHDASPTKDSNPEFFADKVGDFFARSKLLLDTVVDSLEPGEVFLNRVELYSYQPEMPMFHGSIHYVTKDEMACYKLGDLKNSSDPNQREIHGKIAAYASRVRPMSANDLVMITKHRGEKDDYCWINPQYPTLIVRKEDNAVLFQSIGRALTTSVPQAKLSCVDKVATYLQNLRKAVRGRAADYS